MLLCLWCLMTIVLEIQTQFLEMKTNNYSLEDGIKRKDNEINQLKVRNEEIERELSKLQKMVKFNPFAKKEMKEKEMIESLNRKMEVQEEEFKRTNETLRMEITSLIKSNSRLKDKLIEVGIEDFDEDENVNCYENAEESNESKDGDLGAPSWTSVDGSPTKNGLNSSPMRFAILKEKELLENKVLDLEAKFKAEAKSNEGLTRKLEENNMILDSIKQQLKESEELANQRKFLIDEMKEHIESITIKHSEEIMKLKSTNEDVNQENKSLIETSESLRREVEELKSSIINYKDQIEELTKEKDNLTSLLEENKMEIAKCVSAAGNRIKEVEMEKERALILITETSSLEVTELKEKLSNKEGEITLLRKEMESMSRKVEDNVEERKIHEKKGLMMVKELKKQIQNEKKRADKLQEKLSQFLSESSHELDIGNSTCGSSSCNHTSCENRLNPSDNPAAQNNDTSSSISSWSFMPGKKGHRRNSSLQSGQSIPNDHSPPTSGSPSAVTNDGNVDVSTCSNVSILESENSQLVSRVSSMQEEKWVMEERLAQLQKAFDKLSGENESKSQIIKFYCMEGRSDAASNSSRTRSDKMTVKRVFDFIKDKGDGNLKEINQKLQRILEETLIKNMHLHQDLERLSNQLVTSASDSASLSSSASTITTPNYK